MISQRPGAGSGGRAYGVYVEMVTEAMPTAGTAAAGPADVREARRMFPATAGRAYFNTAAVGLASQRLADAYHAFVEEWADTGLTTAAWSGPLTTHDPRWPGCLA